MRFALAFGLGIGLAIPISAAAQSPPQSKVTVLYRTVKPGAEQTVDVTAVDLSGNPLVHAAVSGFATYGTDKQTVHFPRTDDAGMSTATFRVPSKVTGSRAAVSVTISNGYLQENATSTFSLVSGHSSVPKPISLPQTLILVARALPPEVTAPEPGWVAVYVHGKNGAPATYAHVYVWALFREAAEEVKGETDGTGTATLRVDTTRARGDERVKLVISSNWQGHHGSTSAELSVKRAASTPRITATVPPSSSRLAPTPVPTPVTTAIPDPTATPVPAPTDAPVLAPTPTTVLASPTVTPIVLPTSAPLPTSTPTSVATWTPTATATPTEVPTPTWTPTTIPSPTPTDTATVGPTATDTPVAPSVCPGSQQGCERVALDMLNEIRAQYGQSALGFDPVQSDGTSSCPGSIGESKTMAENGNVQHYLWNQNWADLCAPGAGYIHAGENIGMSESGNEVEDLQTMYWEFMNNPNEEHDYAYCQTHENHACNILGWGPTAKYFAYVGIGIYESGGATWFTLDFRERLASS